MANYSVRYKCGRCDAIFDTVAYGVRNRDGLVGDAKFLIHKCRNVSEKLAREKPGLDGIAAPVSIWEIK